MKISYFSFLCSHHPPSSPTTDDSLGRDAYQSGDDHLNDNNDKRCKSDSDIYIYIYISSDSKTGRGIKECSLL